ncbi:AMP-binding protein [Cupriavidus basilensis]
MRCAALRARPRGVPRAALMALGVAPGERVAVWAPNLHEWIVAALSGIQMAGGVLVPLNTRLMGGGGRRHSRAQRRAGAVQHR